MTATDDDVGDTLEYKLGLNDPLSHYLLLEVATSTGQLTVSDVGANDTSGLDADQAYLVVLTVQDGEGGAGQHHSGCTTGHNQRIAEWRWSLPVDMNDGGRYPLRAVCWTREPDAYEQHAAIHAAIEYDAGEIAVAVNLAGDAPQEKHAEGLSAVADWASRGQVDHDVRSEPRSAIAPGRCRHDQGTRAHPSARRPRGLDR